MFDTQFVASPVSTSPRDGELDAVVGRNLRRLRKSRGMSLDRFSSLTGVSKAMLGQIEQGQSSPSIRILWKIAKSLNLPVGAFLSGSADEGPYLLPAHAAILVSSADGRCRSRALFPDDRSRRVQFYELHFDGLAGQDCGPHPPGVTENLVVCQGSLVVTVGDSEYRLIAGDALFFEADVPHRYRNPQSEEALAFLVMHSGETP